MGIDMQQIYQKKIDRRIKKPLYKRRIRNQLQKAYELFIKSHDTL